MILPAVVAASPALQWASWAWGALQSIWPAASTLSPLHPFKAFSQYLEAGLNVVKQYAAQLIVQAARVTQPVMYYDLPSGGRMPVYDIYFSPSSRATPQQLAEIKDVLDTLPRSHVSRLPAIVLMPTGPVYGGSLGFADFSNGLGLYSGAAAAQEVLRHEVGHFALQFATRERFLEWETLHRQMSSPGWDTVSVLGGVYLPFARFQEQAATLKPYGSTNAHEDFATIYAYWTIDSGKTATNAETSSSILEESIRRASVGHPQLLVKTLFVASMFTDERSKMNRAYNREGDYFNPGKTHFSETALSLTTESFQVGGAVFKHKDGILTSADVGGRTYTFETSITLTVETRRAWGIPVLSTAKLEPVRFAKNSKSGSNVIICPPTH
jgi:hypothetical protein